MNLVLDAALPSPAEMARYYLEDWLVPLVLVVLAAAAVIFLLVRRRKKQKEGKK